MTAGNIPGRPRKLAALVLLTAALAVGLPDNGLADPPPWAPAHGWRQKQGQQVYSSEYAYDPAVTRQHYSSISRGTCDRGLLAGTFSTSTNNIVGSLLGGAVGGLVGNQFGRGSGRTAMTVLGAVDGALAGGAIGRSMEPPDQACIGQTLEHAPTNRTVAWRNPDNNAQYQVTPVRTWQAQDGVYCRDYQTSAVIDGRRERMTGTACREPDGSWRVQN